MKKYTFIITLLICNLIFSKEIKIDGRIKTDEGKELSFVNIGIKNKNIGTISDEKGNFSLIIDETKVNEILTFSYVGFEELNIKIENILKTNLKDFILKPKANVLAEVVVISKKTKEIKIGTTSYSSSVAGYVRADNAQNNDIQEFAKKINLKKPSKISDLNIHLFGVRVDSARFRINVYNIKDNMPFEKINTENIVVKQKITNGWIKLDLNEFDLKYDVPIFITLEYIPKTIDENDPFRYNGQFFGEAVGRTSSLGTWKRRKGISMAMYVTVKQ